ncbi:MAG: hypothetical protein HY704_17335 [Gemmatimonadetes bacterium]|nr:hypothetical protein [Gemmatimonadota bacterium]
MQFWRRLIPGFFLLAALAVQACDATPRTVKEEARKRWVREAGIESFDPAGGSPLAGVSARRAIAVEPLKPGDVAADTASHEFHRFVHRCSACHEPPSPRLHPSDEWAGVVNRMAARADSAGILPLSAGERQEILRFLLRHARDR